MQSLLLNPLHLAGVTPTLLPLIPAFIAVLEPDAHGLTFGLCYGVACDLALRGAFPCFYLLLSVTTVIVAGGLCTRLLRRGVLCSLAAGGVALLLSSLLHGLVVLAHGARPTDVLLYALTECALSLPLVFPMHPLFSALYGRLHLYD